MAPAPLPHLYHTSFRSERLPLEALGARLATHPSVAAALAAARRAGGPAAAAAASGGGGVRPAEYVCQFSYNHRSMALEPLPQPLLQPHQQ